MSTTLTNGLKLPDKGSVDWYADMQSNYAILDGAVGTVAEHTSQIAGKASAVHTHTKSDITDLFNSANTWSDHNTYTKYIYMQNSSIEIGNAPSNNTSKEITFTDKNNATLSRVLGKTGSNGESYIALHACNKYLNGAIDPNGTNVDSFFYVGIDATGNAYNVHKANTYPETNNSYDLGISGKQWNNLYAKNYYYNGVAWGLDKVNTWSANQTFLTNPTIKNNGLEKGVSPTANSEKTVVFTDKNDNQISSLYARMNTNGESYVALRAENFYKNGAMDSTGDLVYSVVFIGMDSQGNPYCVPRADLYPDNTNRFNLGTSSKKWKTLNGVNPGALSLPDTLGTSGTENVNYFNVIGYLNNTGALVTIPSTATYDGWLYINAKDGADSYIIIDDSPSSFGTSVFGNNGLGAQGIGLLCLMCPIRKGHAYNVRIKSAGIVSARIYPAQGNV